MRINSASCKVSAKPGGSAVPSACFATSPVYPHRPRYGLLLRRHSELRAISSFVPESKMRPVRQFFRLKYRQVSFKDDAWY